MDLKSSVLTMTSHSTASKELFVCMEPPVALFQHKLFSDKSYKQIEVANCFIFQSAWNASSSRKS